MDYWYGKVQEKGSHRYRRSVRLVGACRIALGEACLSAYTREWTLSIHLGKIATWALTQEYQEWALTRATVIVLARKLKVGTDKLAL